MADDTHNPYRTMDLATAPILPGFSQRTRNTEATEALRILNMAGPVVYAIRTKDGLIKIGVTSQMSIRRRKLGPHDDILALKIGDRVVEQQIHARLTDHRHHGNEWYYPTPGVMAVINEMREDLGLKPLAA
jgi:hypothetical protein